MEGNITPATPSVDNSPAAAPALPSLETPAQPTIQASEPSQTIIPPPEPAQPSVEPPKYTRNPLLEDIPPALGANQPQQTVVEPQATPADPGSQPEQLILGKFKTVDDLTKSYTELERTLSQKGEEVSLYKRQLESVLPLLENIQAAQPQAQAQPQPQPEPEPTFQFLDEIQDPAERERIQEEYYNDPLKFQSAREKQLINAVGQLLNKALQPIVQQVQPIVQQHVQAQQINHFTQQVNSLMQADPAAKDALVAAKGLFDANPDLGKAISQLPNAMEVAYNLGKQLMPKPEPTPEQLLQDPNFLQTVISHPEVKNNILKSHVEAIKQGQPPPVMGSQPGQAPAAPAQKPKSIKEASNFVRAWLAGGRG